MMRTPFFPPLPPLSPLLSSLLSPLLLPLEVVKLAGTTATLAVTAGSGMLLGSALRLLERPRDPVQDPAQHPAPHPASEAPIFTPTGTSSTTGTEPPSAAAFATGPEDRADLENFLDRFFEREGVGREIGSAAFVMVKGGQVFFQKSYGGAPETGPGETGAPAGERPFLVASSTNVYLASLADLGRLLLALLAGGLTECTSSGAGAGLYRHRFAQHPFVRDAVYGLFETCIGRRRALFHTSGCTDRTKAPNHTLLYLLPEERMGFYVLISGAAEARAFSLRTRLVQKLLDRYYPAE